MTNYIPEQEVYYYLTAHDGHSVRIRADRVQKWMETQAQIVELEKEGKSTHEIYEAIFGSAEGPEA